MHENGPEGGGEKAPVKVDRSAFLYLEPGEAGVEKREVEDFAQCASCPMFAPKKRRCTIHGPDVVVLGTDSCGLYVPGMPMGDDMDLVAHVRGHESGLHWGRVQCHRCREYEGEPDGRGTCAAFRRMNDALAEHVAADPDVAAHGCCNLWRAKA